MAEPSPGDREALADEAVYLRTSLEDLDREHAAGDLDGADYATLRARYEERVANIEAALERVAVAERRAPGPPERSPTRPGARGWLSARRHRTALAWSAAGCFAVAATLLGLSAASVAPFASAPGATLSLSARIRIELAEAGVLASNKDLVQAVAVYDRVLELDPEQPEALADGGWLVRLAGLSAKRPRVVASGDGEIAAAVAVAPGYALAHAYEGIALYEDDHSPAGALAQFRAMLADRPSATLLGSVRPVAVAAYRALGVALPAELSSSAPATSG